MNMKKNKYLLYLSALIILSFTLTDKAMSLDISLGLSAGYDDNLSQEQTAVSSAFTSHQIKLYQLLFSDISSAEGNIFIEGDYQNYSDVPDNYKLRGGLSFSFPLAKGRLLPSIFSEAAIYRDSFISEDERDEMLAGGAVEWLATGRFTLIVRQTWNWSDYKEPVILYTGSHASESGAGKEWSHGHGGENQHQQSFSRDDRISSSEIEGKFFLSPTIETSLSAECNYLNSSAETESYLQNALYLSFLWKPHDMWEISAKSFLKNTDYDNPALERTDKTFFISLGISCFIRNFEIFLQVENTENDSSLDIESYHQTVTQCGFLFSF